MEHKRKYFIILAGILLVYFAVSLYRLQDVPPPAFDEIAQLNIAEHLANDNEIRCDFYSSKFGDTNVYNSLPTQWVLLAGFIKIFGLNFLGIRIFYIILSIIALLAVYGLMLRVTDIRTSVLAVLFLAASHTFFDNSRLIIYHVPAMAFSIVAVLIFYMARDRNSRGLFVLSGFMTGIACLAHPLGAGAGLVISGLFLYKRISIKYFLLFISGGFAAFLPYVIYILVDFQEYLRQTSFVLDDVYDKQPLYINMLDEIPVRYFGFPSLKEAFIRLDAERGYKYIYSLKWMVKNLNLKVYLCDAAEKVIFLISLLFLGFKRNRTKGQSEIFLMGIVYVLFLSLFPNKFGPYVYTISPYLAMCMAVFIHELLYPDERILQWRVNAKKIIAYIIMLVFFAANLLLIYKDLATKRVVGYFGFMDKAVSGLPDGATVAAPAYFWLRMYDDYDFVLANKIIYDVDAIMEEKKGGIKFSELSAYEQDRIIEDIISRYGIRYIFITCHNWEQITEAPMRAEGFYDGLVRYLFYNADKEADYLRSNYYSGSRQPETHKEEKYHSPVGYYNVSAEYQNSLKIYKLK